MADYSSVQSFSAGGRDPHEDRLQRLLYRLPQRWRGAVQWLRRPEARGVRIVAAVLLILGSLLSLLPLFGLWMLPLGLVLLAEDVPPLRRLRSRMLEWLERRRPHWFGPHGSIDAEGTRLPRAAHSTFTRNGEKT